MINLLPPSEKLLVRFEKNKQLVLVWGIMTLSSLVSFALILIIVQLAVLDEVNQQEIYLAQVKKQSQNDNFLSFKNIIQQHNKSIVKAHNFYKSNPPLAPILDMLSEVQRPEGIIVTKIELKQIEKVDMEGQHQVGVIMNGISEQRENLIAFKESIERHPSIQEVRFPPDNWVKSSQTDFSVTFNVIIQ